MYHGRMEVAVSPVAGEWRGASEGGGEAISSRTSKAEGQIRNTQTKVLLRLMMMMMSSGARALFDYWRPGVAATKQCNKVRRERQKYYKQAMMDMGSRRMPEEGSWIGVRSGPVYK